MAQQILTDTGAQRVLITEIGYSDGSEQVLRLAQGDSWSTDPDEDPPSVEFVPHLARGLNVISDLAEGGTLGGIGDADGLIEVINTNGRYDDFSAYTVEGRTVKSWVVGTLSNGTRVRYSDVYDEPVFVGVGVDRPKRGRRVLRIGVKGPLYKMDRLINPRSFSPPCIEFPGTSAGVDFEDNFDFTGSFTVEAWVYCIDPSTSGQFLWQKDTGVAGWGCQIGTAGSGAVRAYVREQSTVNTDSAASVISPSRWHHVAMAVNTSAQTRIITIDGTTVATTSALTGSPANNSASFKLGVGLRGRMSRVRLHSTAKTATQIRAEMYLPWLGTESNLAGLPNLQEGSGSTTEDSKSGSTVVGTLGSGVTWSGTSEWCGDSLVGKQWPEVLGYAKDVPLIPIDTALGIWAVANGPVVSIPVVKSNHNPLTLTTHYTVDLARGLVTITGGTTGSYSADVVANILFGGAAGFDGVDDFGSHTVTCPAGAMTLEMLVRPRQTSSTLTRYCGGWRNGTSAGARFLVFDTFAVNSLAFQVRNDAGTSFVVRATGLTQGRMYHAAGVLDPTAGFIRIYVDGALIASTAISGTWSTVLSTFVLARTPDASSNFQNCVLDEVRIWSVVRTQAEILEGMVQEITSGTGLVRRWGFSEGSGNAVDSVAAGTLTLTGATWTYSRHRHGDMLLGTLTGAADYSASELDLAAAAAYVRDFPGDSGWYVGTSAESCRDVWSPILKAAHSYLVASSDGASLLMGQISLPTGTPDDGLDFEEWAFPMGSPPDLDEEASAALPSVVAILHARNWSPIDKETVINIATSDATTFAYAISEWRQVAEPGPSSYGEPLILETALLLREDARAELTRVLPFYSEDRERCWFTFGKAGLVLLPHSELRQIYRTGDGTARLGMGDPGRCFRVIRLIKVHGRGATRVEALGLA